MSEEKDHNFKRGEWFYALDGAVYEFIDDKVGSRKICEVVDLEKTAFMSGAMKKRGYVMAAAPEMYTEIERDIAWLNRMIVTHGDSHPMTVVFSQMKGLKKKLLAKARGEL